MFGASIFASLAITATGFAAWVLSTDAMAETEGGVEVASVSDAGVEIKDLAFLDKNGDAPITNFVFEPAANDTDGRVRQDEDGNAEDMDLRIGWTVKNYHNVATSYIEFKIPETVKNAIDKGYIALPEGFVLKGDAIKAETEEIDGVVYYTYTFDMTELVSKNVTTNETISFTKHTASGVTDIDFVLNLKFVWGSAFDGDGDGIGINPSLYYDTAYTDTTKGVGVDYETVKATLLDLKACVYGVTDADKAAALSKIENTELKNSVSDKGIMDILSVMTAEEQDAFYATKTMPTYKLVVHATVN